MAMAITRTHLTATELRDTVERCLSIDSRLILADHLGGFEVGQGRLGGGQWSEPDHLLSNRFEPYPLCMSLHLPLAISEDRLRFLSGGGHPGVAADPRPIREGEVRRDREQGCPCEIRITSSWA